MDKVVSTYSKQWYTLRKTHLGASEISALCGIDPWKTPDDVWASKYDDQHLQPESGVNSKVWWGHADEANIIEAAVHDLGRHDMWKRSGLSWHGVIPGMMVSPDAVLCGQFVPPEEIPDTFSCQVIEAKSVGSGMKGMWREGPPRYVLMQLYAQMVYMNARKGHVAARVGGAPVRVWSFEPDNEMSLFILDLVKQFWENPTKPDDWDMVTASRLQRMGFLPQPKPAVAKDISMEDAQILFEWEHAKQQERKAKEKRAQLDTQVKELFDDKDALTVFGRTMAFRSEVTRTTVDVDTLLEENPHLVDKYWKSSTYSSIKATNDLKEMR